MYVYIIVTNPASGIDIITKVLYGLIAIMATTVLPMTTLGYNSNANSTWPVDQGNVTWRPYVMDPNEILDLQRRYIPIIVFSVLAHLSILALILCHKSLRTQPFFIRVLSMTTLDIIYYMIVFPIDLDREITWGKWRHGNFVCTVYIVLINSKLYITAFMIIGLCIERLMAKLRSVAVVGERTATIVSRVFLVLPWCLCILGGLFIGLEKQDEMSKLRDVHGKYFVFLVEETFHIPYLVIMHMIPLGLLVMIPTAMMAVYKCKKSDWDRLSAKTVEPEAVSLRMSTLCVWIVSIVYFVLCFPSAYRLSLLVFCIRGMATCPSWQFYLNTNTVSLLSGAVTPFLWIITVEIRAALLSVKSRVMNMMSPSSGQKTTVSFSSLRLKMSSDETDIGH